MMNETIHGTMVQINGHGILLRGASGSGKSSLAIRLIDDVLVAGGKGFLVADDRIILDQDSLNVYGRAPDSLFGLIEMRGIGLIELAATHHARINLLVDLVSPETLDRMPSEDSQTQQLCGHAIQAIKIAARNPDAGVIIRTILRSPPVIHSAGTAQI